MKIFRKQQPLTSESGFILALSLVLLTLLTIVSSSTLFLSRSGLKVSSNFSKTIDSFQAANTGWLRGRKVLKACTDFDDVLRGADDNGGALLTECGTGTVLKDFAYSDSTVSIYVSNDKEDIAGSGSETDDDNNKIVLNIFAVGKFGETVEIEAYLEKLDSTPTLPGIPGAAGICGAESEVDLSGSSTISGYDWTVPTSFGCTGGGCAGTTDYDPANAIAPITVEEDLGSGLTRRESSAIEGNPNSVVVDPTIECDDWETLSNQLAALGSATVLNTDSLSGGTMGTRADPEVTIINPPGGALTLSGGVDGAGVLVVTGDTEVTVTGSFHFEGVVLILGDNGALTTSGTTDIFGAVIVNSGVADSDPELETQGSSNLKYSSEALVSAIEAIESATGLGALLTVSWAEKYQ
jgi:hypothetical protein